jgi:hypothetical protein
VPWPRLSFFKRKKSKEKRMRKDGEIRKYVQ